MLAVLPSLRSFRPYEEPHAGAESSSSEAIEAGNVRVETVRAVAAACHDVDL